MKKPKLLRILMEHEMKQIEAEIPASRVLKVLNQPRVAAARNIPSQRNRRRPRRVRVRKFPRLINRKK